MDFRQYKSSFLDISVFDLHTLFIRKHEVKQRYGLGKAKGLSIYRQPLHKRIEMFLLYDGFFSFAAVRQIL